MPLLPLWSGIILSTVNPASYVCTDSNASVENWFRIVKHSIYNSDDRLRAADFIRTIYVNIDDRIAAFKFAFTPFAHKVFKLKRKLLVENEEDCKEEWSRRKKSKISYINSSKDKISRVFESMLPNKEVIECPSLVHSITSLFGKSKTPQIINNSSLSDSSKIGSSCCYLRIVKILF